MSNLIKLFLISILLISFSHCKKIKGHKQPDLQLDDRYIQHVKSVDIDKFLDTHNKVFVTFGNGNQLSQQAYQSLIAVSNAQQFVQQPNDQNKVSFVYVDLQSLNDTLLAPHIQDLPVSFFLDKKQILSQAQGAARDAYQNALQQGFNKSLLQL
ncbi:hypothetical protein ABPG73_012432 [Tetrahymena malaccensis]